MALASGPAGQRVLLGDSEAERGSTALRGSETQVFLASGDLAAYRGESSVLGPDASSTPNGRQTLACPLLSPLATCPKGKRPQRCPWPHLLLHAPPMTPTISRGVRKVNLVRMRALENYFTRGAAVGQA